MAQIILGSYMIRYPLGGNLSWALQFLKGFQMLGHDIYFFEKANYSNACYDPKRNVMADDPAEGIEIVKALLEMNGLGDKWCFVDIQGTCYGRSRSEISNLFRSADIYIDMGAHGAWEEESILTPIRVLIEGEPGYTQMLMENSEKKTNFDFYYSAGCLVGTERTKAPDAGRSWRHLWNLVATDLFSVEPPPAGASFTTVMNWQSHKPIIFDGQTFGQKDIEFQRFMSLPSKLDTSLEVSVSGKAPIKKLKEHGWRTRDAKSVTKTVEQYYRYIRDSKGEFSVCKNVFVQTYGGWFSDRSAVYLASGRPVILQETGFSEKLPCGKGLFAVTDIDQAAEAIREVELDYEEHSRAAREIAIEYLDAKKLLSTFIDDIGGSDYVSKI
ncbi:glycosyltransferase [Haliea sp. E17]|uniref:glycosyltransferase n=1 Tax=Haliea sp. E17 TaxID=3401576 RepID=UPI003AAE4389